MGIPAHIYTSLAERGHSRVGGTRRALVVVAIAATAGVLTGLVAEESPERIVLKTQGGKLETIAGSDVEETTTSRLSLMPEELEKSVDRQGLADVIAYLRGGL